MDIKCHTQQLQQHQQQQHQTNMLMSGNGRMLTTSISAASATQPSPTSPSTESTAADTATVNDNNRVSTQPMTTHMNSSSALVDNHENSVTPVPITATRTTTTTTTATTTAAGIASTTNVNGSCNNHNDNKSNSNQNSRHHTNNERQSNPCGPSPPVHPTAALLADIGLNTDSERVALGECNINGGGGGTGVIGSQCAANNNNDNYNHNNICEIGTLPLQNNFQQHQFQQQLNGQLQVHIATTRIHKLHSAHPFTPSIAIHTSFTTPQSSMQVPCSDGRPTTSLIHCGYCCQPICDRYIMRVVDTSFHEGCLKCAICSLHLIHSCFARDGKLYCRIDYERLFLRNRCLGCGHTIASDELVMRTLENIFHLKCFACVVCGALLKKGEQYIVKQGQLFCRFDYEKEVEMLQGYDFYGDDLFPTKLDGRRGPKRPRTILNTQQRRAFKASFEVSPKPCRKVRENLAKETGLSLRIVQVWFQNQRAKVKKIQKKAKQEHSKGTSDSQDSQESDSSLAKIKDEAHSDDESLLESPFSTCGAGGSVNSISDSIIKSRCVKDERENTPFNCMETNKENCNKTNEPIMNTILGLSYATFQQLMGPFTQSPMINPIDRLYSMQNSYFRPDELNCGECGKGLADN